ncbi:MAG: transposase [Deltaproteobacteria bacterium]|nr:transposase [Deltaproteobacteria bacterium]
MAWEALKNGTLVSKINRFYPSSKTCSSCGHIFEELSLEEREWTCPERHSHHDRDINAAINIQRVGASTLGGGDARLVSTSSLR